MPSECNAAAVVGAIVIFIVVAIIGILIGYWMGCGSGSCGNSGVVIAVALVSIFALMCLPCFFSVPLIIVLFMVALCR